MDVSIIIVNYNTKELLADCLQSIKEKTNGIKYEVIVVDNNSKDGSQEVIPIQFPWVKWIESGENLGFGKANNLGYEYSSGRYIFLLNSDTILVNNAIKILADFMDSHPRCAICGGQLYDKSGHRMHSFQLILPSILNEINSILMFIPTKFFESVQRKKNKPFKVGYISGADMMLRRTNIERYGMFDPDFFMYYEETELTLRHRKAGTSYFVPQAKIIHIEGASNSANFKKFIVIEQSRQIYLSKRYRRIKHSLCNGLHLTTLYFGLIYFKCRRNVRLIQLYEMGIKAFWYVKNNFNPG